MNAKIDWYCDADTLQHYVTICAATQPHLPIEKLLALFCDSLRAPESVRQRPFCVAPAPTPPLLT